MSFGLNEQEMVLKIINKYNNTDITVIKSNIAILTKRKRCGYSEQDLSDMMNISVYTLQEWRKPTRPNKPSFEMALKLADKLGINILMFTI